MLGPLLNSGHALATSETHRLCVYEAYSLEDHDNAILGKQKEEKYIWVKFLITSPCTSTNWSDKCVSLQF